MTNSCDANQTILDLTNETIFLNFVYTSSEWIPYQIIFPCIILFGICTNISFIWTVINTPSLHTNTYKYLVNLAVSDLLFLMIYYIPRIVYYYKSPLKNSLPYTVYGFNYFFFCSSLGTVTLVSLERFLAICYPIKHHLIKGTRRTYKLIFSVWCISLCLSSPYLLASGRKSFCVIWPEDIVYADYPNQFVGNEPNWMFEFILAINFGIFFFLMIFNNILFIKIFFAVRDRQNKDLGINSSSYLQHRQIANMLIVNGVFFFLCLSLQMFSTPVLIIYAYLDNNVPEDVTQWLYFIWGKLNDIFFGLNACMNPVLYLITNRRYRHAFVTVFRRNVQNETGINSITLPNINRV